MLATRTHLLGEPAREERRQVFGVELQEAFEVRFDEVDVIFLFRQLRQVLRVEGFALRDKDNNRHKIVPGPKQGHSEEELVTECCKQAEVRTYVP